MWLGYPDGRLYFSNVGDPTDFDSTTFAGVIYMKDDIVDLKVTKGDVLVVFCKNSIQIIKALSTTDITDQVVVDYLFSNVTFKWYIDIFCYNSQMKKERTPQNKI